MESAAILPLWPELAAFLAPAELAAGWARVRPAFLDRLRAHRIPESAAESLAAAYLPLAAWTAAQQGAGTLVLGVNGAQGSGKSTLCDFLAFLLDEAYGRRAAVLSIDDLYKTRAERRRMAREVHPLFVTRGVPGTHDADLGLSTIRALSSARPGDSTPLPAFDKARDDRQPPEAWPVFRGRPDIILFEGWCVGSAAQPEVALAQPVNALERDEDADGIWRRTANDRLKDEYAALFGELDRLVLLKAPGMDRVLEWRGAQERKLAEARRGDPGFRPMDAAALRRFVMHYERLTRHNLAEMPGRADVVLHLDEGQRFARIEARRR
jgi:D-glycerate 3-kinase